MLVVVLAANLALENFVEPKVMGETLDIHPLVVLVVTALGGLLGGIVGLIVAVPAWVIASDAISRARSRGVLQRVTERAQPSNACSPPEEPVNLGLPDHLIRATRCGRAQSRNLDDIASGASGYVRSMQDGVRPGGIAIATDARRVRPRGLHRSAATPGAQ